MAIKKKKNDYAPTYEEYKSQPNYQAPTTAVKFNKDGTREVSVGNTTTAYTKDQFKNTRYGTGSMASFDNPELAKEREAIQKKEMVKKAVEDAQFKQDVANVVQSGGTTPQEQPLNQEAQPMQETQQVQEEQTPLDYIPQTQKVQETSSIKKLNNYLVGGGLISLPVNKGISFQDNIDFVSNSIFAKATGEIYDVVQSIWNEGKGLDQKSAEAQFSDIKASISGDLDLIRQGLKDPSDLSRKVDRARSANSRLASSVKGLNQLNLRYFKDNGADVQVQLVENEEYLKDVEMQLEALKQAKALQQSNVMASFQRLGLQ